MQNSAVMRYRAVMEDIRKAAVSANRAEDAVKLVGVTKTVDAQIINAVLADGLSVIGENRVQEFLSKYEQYQLNGVSVHFIGALQRNKVKYIIDKVDMIESVDSIALAEEISKRAEKCGKVMPVLIEINIDEQQSKSGLLPEETLEAMQAFAKLKGIAVKGLMCIPDPEKTPGSFMRMRALADTIKEAQIPGICMEELSMGMSGDYKDAISYGATYVRVGRGIFGDRVYKPSEIADEK